MYSVHRQTLRDQIDVAKDLYLPCPESVHNGLSLPFAEVSVNMLGRDSRIPELLSQLLAMGNASAEGDSLLSVAPLGVFPDGVTVDFAVHDGFHIFYGIIAGTFLQLGHIG